MIIKNLCLERPIAFIDVETTGLDPYSDRIVELSILKIYPDGKEEYSSHKINPEMPIPESATAIHGISDRDVTGEPTFKQYAKSVKEFLSGCDISGFNVIRFDLPCLESEFSRVGMEFTRKGKYLIDSQVIYHQRDPRDLKSAYRKYCGKDMEHNHRAEDDARASAEVLEGQLVTYPDLPRDVPQLSALCYEIREEYVDNEGKFIWVDDEVFCNFGKKHKGHKLRDIAEQDRDYLHWIANANFSLKIREIIVNALNGRFPERGQPPDSPL
jgi:DNA polymerase III subunit epsilon